MEINLDFVRIAQKHSAKEKAKEEAKARERKILAEREERARKYHRDYIVRNILDNIISFGAIFSATILVIGMAYILYIITGLSI